jgi:hypothetical protein
MEKVGIFNGYLEYVDLENLMAIRKYSYNLVYCV